MNCEYCNDERDGSFASGRFCNVKCSRGFSTKIKRKTINEKVSKSLTKNFICKNCKKIFKSFFALSGHKSHCGKSVEYTSSRFNGNQGWRKGRNATNDDRIKSKYYSTSNYENIIFIENSNFSSGKIKQILLKEGKELKCDLEDCGIENWKNKKLTFELDHIDGNNKNNLRSNLRFLCPNCHSQTETWRGRNTNTGKLKVTDDVLISALKEERNIRQALLRAGLTPKGANYDRAKKA